MKKEIRNLAKSVAPWAPRPLVLIARYPREYFYVRGFLKSNNLSSSVVFFTTNKTASKLMARILRYINDRVMGLTPLNLAGYIWDSSGGSTVRDSLNSNAEFYFRDNGFLYAPLRQAVDLSHLKTARILSVLRDPRDQIVSGYLGALAHRPPIDPVRRKAFLLHREYLEMASLDSYVLQAAPSLLARYKALQSCTKIENLLTYEQLWSEPESFVNALASRLKVQLDPVTRGKVMDMLVSHFSGTVDGVRVAWQKGKPGDFLNHLKPEVADQLTTIFSDILDWMFDKNV